MILPDKKIVRRISAIDGLRGVAILFVLAGHGLEAYHPAIPDWLGNILGNASFGVRLFFVLSGYLITSLLVKEWQKHGSISLGKFYLRRSLRIFPPFYLYLAAILILRGMGAIEVSWPQFLSAATYTWNYLGVWNPSGPSEGHWFLGHLWTLCLEEQFYLLWPAALILLGFRKAKWVALILPFLIPVVRIASYYIFPTLRGDLGMMFHTAIDGIMVGCAFALWLPEDFSESPVIFNPTVIVICSLFVLLISPLIAGAVRPYRITVGFGLEAAAAGVLVVVAARGRNLFTSFLSWRPLAFLGRISYSVYLWQQLFLTPLNRTWMGSFPISVVCVIAIALISYYGLELPLMKLKGRFDRA